MAGKCPAITTSSWTPSMCKSTFAPANATAALVDATWTQTKTAVDTTVDDPAAFYKIFCGDGKVKAGADNAWVCAYAAMQAAQITFGCNKDTDCKKTIIPACESWTAMATGVCTLTADEITAAVAAAKKQGEDGGCINKADGGLEFAPPAAAAATTAPPATTPKPAAASGSSPMWALALAACLVAGAPAVSRSV